MASFSTQKNDLMKFCSLLALLAGSVRADFNPAWNKPLKPFPIVGNVYYVGTNYLASYLITTPNGHILVNPNFEESVPIIQKNVEDLGFRFADVKIILISHAHDDHAAGCALMKKLTGAQLMVMDADVPLIERGGEGDFAYLSRWQGVKVDRVLHDLSKVELGGSVLTAHLTAGHTKGCTTWTMDVKDGGKLLHVVIVGSPNVNPGYKLVENASYPNIAADYAKGFQVLELLPCDVFLGAHGAYFDMDKKLQAKRGRVNPFVDPAGYRAYVADRKRAFEKELAAQK